MINLLKEYFNKDICAIKTQEYKITGNGSTHAIDIIKDAAKKYMSLYNRINISIFENETDNTYTIWIKNRNSKNFDDSWFLGIDKPYSMSEYYINFHLDELRKYISIALYGQKIIYIKYEVQHIK